MVKESKPLSYGAGKGDKGSFDPSAPPPFKIAEIRAFVPKYCWVKNPWKSLCYVLRDVVVIIALIGATIWSNPFLSNQMFQSEISLSYDCSIIISFEIENNQLNMTS
ncbi:unnamed protein product [Lupinus luteus]|uniref:Fatty acid desaturase N-terminal domain-containing protein n=1 Tax=Lupinus luteus TaxID=3873 RepID=A0AAV1X021_LUPLU